MAEIDLTQFDGHTPGPWHECDHHGRRWIETIRDDAVAQIVRTGVQSATVANSALIRAAPDLLAEIKRQAAEIERMTEQLRRWESYREEIADKERRLGGLARNFLELEAWEDAAKCALKAEGMKWVRGRMPQGEPK